MPKAFTSLSLALLSCLPLLAQTTLVDISRGVPAQEYQTTTKPFLSNFLQCLHGARSAPCYINIVGDSRSKVDNTMSRAQGNQPLTLDIPYGYRWADKLRRDLQAVYGSHGTGMVPLYWGIGSNGPDPDYFTLSGGAYTASSYALGPYQVNGSGTATAAGLISMTNGEVLTFHSADIKFDTLRLFCMTTSSSGSLAVSVDGMVLGSACATPTGTPAPHAPSFGPLSLALHTATMTCTGTCFIYAAEGIAGNSGVSVSNLSVGSASMEYFSHAVSQFAFSDLVPHALTVVYHLTNEAGDGISGTQYSQSLTNVFAHETALGASMLFISPSQDGIADQAAYFPLLKAFAQSHPVAFIDLRDRYGPAQVGSLFGPDGVHENRAGNAEESAMIEAALLDGALSPPLTGKCDANQVMTGLDRFGQMVCQPAPYQPPPTCGQGYAYSIPITIPHGVVFESSPAMPWLFSFNGDAPNSITLTALKSLTNGGQVASVAALDAILCSLPSGGVQYPHELVAGSWNANTGAAEIFASLPVSSLSDTTVYLFLGNPRATDSSRSADVWADYAAAYHFGSDATLGNDSTHYQNNLFGYGVGYGRSVGMFGAYASFSDSGGLIDYSPAGLPENTDARTVQAWFKFPSAPTREVQLFGYGNYAHEGNFSVDVYPPGNVLHAGTPSGAPSISFTADTSWHFLAISLKDGTPSLSGVEMFLDGTSRSVGCSSSSCLADYKTESSPIELNGVYGAGDQANVLLDEVRIARVYLSPARLKTEYLNMTNPSEVTLGTPVAHPAITAPASGTLPVCIDSNSNFVNCP